VIESAEGADGLILLQQVIPGSVCDILDGQMLEAEYSCEASSYGAEVESRVIEAQAAEMTSLAAFVEVIGSVLGVIDRSHESSYFMYFRVIFLGIFNIQVWMVFESLLDFVMKFGVMVGISGYDAVRIILVFIISHGINEAIEVRMEGRFASSQSNPRPDFALFTAFLQHILPGSQ